MAGSVPRVRAPSRSSSLGAVAHLHHPPRRTAEPSGYPRSDPWRNLRPCGPKARTTSSRPSPPRADQCVTWRHSLGAKPQPSLVGRIYRSARRILSPHGFERVPLRWSVGRVTARATPPFTTHYYPSSILLPSTHHLSLSSTVRCARDPSVLSYARLVSRATASLFAPLSTRSTAVPTASPAPSPTPARPRTRSHQAVPTFPLDTPRAPRASRPESPARARARRREGKASTSRPPPRRRKTSERLGVPNAHDAAEDERQHHTGGTNSLGNGMEEDAAHEDVFRGARRWCGG